MSNDFAGISEESLVPASLTGFRQWRTNLNGKLRSVSYEYTWQPEETASCRELKSYGVVGPKHDENKVPDETCTCGIYGWYTPDYSFMRHSGDILGVIEVQGRTLMGSTGFRTEKAKIVAVTRPRGLETAAGHNTQALRYAWEGGLRNSYPGIKVYDTPAGLLSDYAPTDVSSLIGENPSAVVDEARAMVVSSFDTNDDCNYIVDRWQWSEVFQELTDIVAHKGEISAALAEYIDRLKAK